MFMSNSSFVKLISNLLRWQIAAVGKRQYRGRADSDTETTAGALAGIEEPTGPSRPHDPNTHIASFVAP